MVDIEQYVSVRVLSRKLKIKRGLFEPISRRSKIPITHCKLHDDRNFQVLSVPESFAAKNHRLANRVLEIKNDRLGPIPFKPGLNLELSLLSTPLASVSDWQTLGDVSELASIPFAGESAQYGTILDRNLDQTIVQTKSQRELTYRSEIQNSGVFAVIEGKDADGEFIFDNQTRSLEQGRTTVDLSYIVFEIETSNERSDWQSIPEIYQEWSNLRHSFIEDPNDCVSQLQSFIRAVVFSPDLVQSQKKKIEHLAIDYVSNASLTNSEELGPLESIEFGRESVGGSAYKPSLKQSKHYKGPL